MNIIFLLVFIVAMLCYAGVHWYIGRRGRQAFAPWLAGRYGKAYGLALALLAAIYPLGRMAERALPEPFGDLLVVIGSYWLGILYYLFLVLLAIDILRLPGRWYPARLRALFTPTRVGIAVVLLVAATVGYGVWNARHPRLRHYAITIAKPAGTLTSLRIVMASDLHLGPIVNERRLAAIVDRIDALNPDLVVLPGDTIDEEVRPFLQRGMPRILARLHPTYGVYAVLGNHEYLGGEADAAVRALKRSGIMVLRDSTSTVAGAITLAGREDPSVRRTGHPRASLPQLLADADPARPLILLDHQPNDVAESTAAGVDLQLSGHTHHGQMFPNGYLTRALFPQDWGYLRRGAYQLIVSCGAGTWGPPLRIGSTPEIVVIDLRFRPAAAAE